MGSLIFIITALALFGGFFALTWYETAHGVRFFAGKRSELDTQIDRIIFIWENVDLAAFAKEEAEHFLRRVGHDVAHLSLQMVRAVERSLTRLVRHFRTRQAVEEGPRETAREFVKTLSDFKDGLDAEHPAISEVDLK
jgi:hypothetical protein